MHLAAKAGINVAAARVEVINETVVAIIRRFDRTDDGGRIPYVSAATMLQSDGRDTTHAYTELVDVLLQEGANPIADTHQLWRRLVFNFLIDPKHSSEIAKEWTLYNNPKVIRTPPQSPDLNVEE